MSIETITSTEASSSAPLIRPEWIRTSDVRRLFGISRSTCYELIASGAIRSCSLRKRGHTRGIRLVNYDSLRAYLDSLPQTPEIEGVTQD